MNPSKTKQSAGAGLLAAVSLLLCSLSLPPAAQSQTILTEQQQLARDIFRELVEIKTTHEFGSTLAAEAAAARLRAAGFAEGDVQVVGARAERGNLVARLRGRGK